VEDKMPHTLKIQKIHPDAIIPSYVHDGDAGFDLRSLEDHTLMPGKRHVFKTGICMEIPQGHFGSIRGRSGLAANHGIDVLGGVIDSGYRGDVGVVLINLGEKEHSINKGDKIAQMVIKPVERVNIEEGVISDTLRGEGGFGSTGIK
jgi:dUTP pyrophosphatase